jgi:hypothetical protein
MPRARRFKIFAGRRAATRPLLCAALALLLLTPATFARGAHELKPGEAVGRELKIGETHAYLVRVNAGQFLRVLVEQRGVDVAVRLFDPGGKKITRVDFEGA